MDRESFFVFSEIWAALLLGCVWMAQKLIPADPATVGFLVSVPFAAILLGAMVQRVRHMQRPIGVLVPVLACYLWIVGEHAIFRHGWPIAIPSSVLAVLGLYTGVLYILVGVTKGHD